MPTSFKISKLEQTLQYYCAYYKMQHSKLQFFIIIDNYNILSTVTSITYIYLPWIQCCCS